MDLAQLAIDFVRASDEDRKLLSEKYASLKGVELARALKDVCVDAWEGDISLIYLSADAAGFLATIDNSMEVGAYADWCKGYSALVRGQMDRAIDHLDRAATTFTNLDAPQDAASTQILKLYPLASLNRFDQAITLGTEIRETFSSVSDHLSTGKVEMNLGNLYWLRDRHAEAEVFFRSARDHFAAVKHVKLLTQSENSLAVTLTALNRFREAEEIYRFALPRAEEAGLDGISAAIESSLGILALSQGHYDRALDLLGRAKHNYERLEMPYQLATTERELADTYLELNLAPEAAEIYERVASAFAKFGTPFEEAHCRVNYARALLLSNDGPDAHVQLAAAAGLYQDCNSKSGSAAVALLRAQLAFVERNFQAAIADSRSAGKTFTEIGLVGKELLCRLLEIEALRGLEKLDEAFDLSISVLKKAEKTGLPQLEWRLHTLQGLILASKGEGGLAEVSLRRSVALVEKLRAPLPAEEFRASFFADKLEPYWELARLCLSSDGRSRASEALEMVERSKARTLVELMDDSSRPVRNDPAEEPRSESDLKLESLREELNWFYSQMNRSPGGPQTDADPMRALGIEARKRETAIEEVIRQQNLNRNETPFDRADHFDLKELQKSIGAGSVFVEYAVFDGKVHAFLIDGEDLNVVRTPAIEDEILEVLKQFRFQIDALRHGSAAIRQHLYELTIRTRHHLCTLYELLIRPIEKLIGLRRMIIAPHRSLHYVPFQALHDGVSHVVENQEIVLVPSAGTWLSCLRKKPFSIRKALLVAVPDQEIPRVVSEVEEIRPMFETSTSLCGDDATLTAVKNGVASANLLHLACHGRFRPDNPLFSAIKLSDGRLTVRDAAALNLQNCSLAVLSACETGLNLVAPGDELIGLMRGFFLAGVPSLILSRWAVDDDATSFLMRSFYSHLSHNKGPSTALRKAQLDTFKRNPHPFFWASFALTGRP